tara:strand:+ start:3804 stop:3920 length:117 start_codon:yes stop_codon:yes gene_type:complete
MVANLVLKPRISRMPQKNSAKVARAKEAVDPIPINPRT